MGRGGLLCLFLVRLRKCIPSMLCFWLGDAEAYIASMDNRGRSRMRRLKGL
jgi:hypothetical protein